MEKKPTYEELERRVRELSLENQSLPAERDTFTANEKLFSQIVEGTPIATFVINADHRITHCNKAWENLTGIPASELIGTRRHWQTFYRKKRPVMADLIVDDAPEEDFARYYGEKYRRSTVIEGAYEAESFFSALGENGKWLFFTASPIRDESGRITGAIETLQDITERKRAEEKRKESERRFRSFLEFLPYPVVVFTVDGRVFYLNPAFTDTFGWSLDELKGQHIPYVPSGLEQETREAIDRLFRENVLMRHETRRLTRDGRVLDVVLSAAFYQDSEGNLLGELVMLRDITSEKRNARNNEALLRISMALPAYPDLEDLLDYISGEVKQLIGCEGALVILLDEESRELFFLGAAYDDTLTSSRVKEFRFPLDQLVAGQVIRTGSPLIVPRVPRDDPLHRERDRKLGYETRNLLLVPLKSSDRTIGVIAGINKKQGVFDDSDEELLGMVAGTVALSVENARFAEDLKDAYRNNETLLRISKSLPIYPDLEELLDYITSEVQRLMGAEGALVGLLEEENEQLFFPGACYEDKDVQERMKTIRIGLDEVAAGRVIRTGEPQIVQDVKEDQRLYPRRDSKLGYTTRSFIEVPLRSSDRIIGVLCAINKKEGTFEAKDIELLSLIGGTVALSIENARFSEELKQSYLEVRSLNRAKDKAINHLSHELKTPVSVLVGSLDILSRKLEDAPVEAWKSTMERARRNLNRIVEIQDQVDDIIQQRRSDMKTLLCELLDQCSDVLETIVAETTGGDRGIELIRERIETLYGQRDLTPERIDLDSFVRERLEAMSPLFTHRQVEIAVDSRPETVFMPGEPLRKIVDGLVRNAVENTPDEGRIEILARDGKDGPELVVRDWGVGITEDAQRRIFEGFFATQDTLHYSSKRPFDFNAGGKGADLLRMRIFSERYGFRISLSSNRCRYIPLETDVCPGRISLCPSCTDRGTCLRSGGTVITVRFPRAPSPDAPSTP
ncbi:MAG: GAF domain-containing protein [Deltaproteobacteria bacterium]|nr:GAF domain-containing protein [Deltaproteobacteria bacterium]